MRLYVCVCAWRNGRGGNENFRGLDVSAQRRCVCGGSGGEFNVQSL